MPRIKPPEIPGRWLITKGDLADFLDKTIPAVNRLEAKGIFSDLNNLKTSVKEWIFYNSEGGTKARIELEKLKKIEMENARTAGNLIPLEEAKAMFDDYTLTLNLNEDGIATKMALELEGVTEGAVRKQILKQAIIDARNNSVQQVRERFPQILSVQLGKPAVDETTEKPRSMGGHDEDPAEDIGGAGPIQELEDTVHDSDHAGRSKPARKKANRRVRKSRRKD